MNPKSYSRYGKSYATGSNRLENEMRSWSKNKREDRKLAMHNASMDKYATERRKSLQVEERLVTKELQQNICKTTPDVDTYLDRALHRFNALRQQEKERLDRKLDSMYKFYLKDYAALHLEEYEAEERQRLMRKVASESDLPSHLSESSSDLSAPDLVANENSDSIGDLKEEIDKMAIDYSKYKRRASTGSVNDHLFTRKSGFKSGLENVKEADVIDGTSIAQDNGNANGDTNADTSTTKDEETRLKKSKRAEVRRASDELVLNRNRSELPKRLSRRSSLANNALPFVR